MTDKQLQKIKKKAIRQKKKAMIIAEKEKRKKQKWVLARVTQRIIDYKEDVRKMVHGLVYNSFDKELLVENLTSMFTDLDFKIVDKCLYWKYRDEEKFLDEE